MHSDLYPRAYFLGGGDSNYVGYTDDPGWADTAALLRSMLVPASPTVLEVGCATGWFVRAALQHGMNAFGVDVSEWAIANPAPDVADFIREASVLDLTPGLVGSYDAVVSWEMLEHIPEAAVPVALRAMKSVLKPGGLLVHRIALEGSEHDHHAEDDKTHFTIVGREWWLAQFENLGGLVRLPNVESAYDSIFRGRDWQGRFFAYRLDA